MINWTRVHELRADIGAEAFDEIVDLFLEEVEEVAKSLRDHDAPLEARLHALKNGALNLGLRDLSDVCQSGETRASGGQTVNVTHILGVYDASIAQFKADLPHQLMG